MNVIIFLYHYNVIRPW